MTWMRGVSSPGTPARYDKVGVIKIGPASARNVLVLEPGTSAGSTYFVPLAQWLVSKVKGWQVWSVERRENLLEDQSVLNLAKEGMAGPTQLFDYYLGWLTNASITHRFKLIPASSVAFVKQWGLRVAVGDLHRVIQAALRLGGKVVLGGHSLGGAVVTAYATWDFHGHAGADQLAGLVYDDGGSFPAESRERRAQRADRSANGQPLAVVRRDRRAVRRALQRHRLARGADRLQRRRRSGRRSALLPGDLKPQVPVTNVAQYGYALNVATSPPSLIAAQAHLGTGISAHTIDGYHTWNGAGALTPIKRFAKMFAGLGIIGADGTEWYFPQRLKTTRQRLATGSPTRRSTSSASTPRWAASYRTACGSMRSARPWDARACCSPPRRSPPNPESRRTT